MAADETFSSFYPRGDDFVVPTGSLSVNTSDKIEDEKAGATVMVAASLGEGLLKPFIIMTAGLNKTLMKKYKLYKKSKVIFNPSHWMDSCSFMIFLNHIRDQLPNRRIALFVDSHGAHFPFEVEAYLATMNKRNVGSEIAIIVIPEGMTPILQVCDVSIIKRLKDDIRKRFALRHLNSLQQNPPGDTKIVISRSDYITMVEDSYASLNRSNAQSHWIAKTFRKCGQDPFTEGNYEDFKQHLEKVQGNTKQYRITEEELSLV